jgi:ABC-type Fe3+ transport system permease subunit
LRCVAQRRLRAGRVVLGCYIALCWTLATVISVVQLYIYKDDEAFRDSIVLQNLSTLLVAVLSAVFSVFVSVRLFCLHRRIKTTIKKVCLDGFYLAHRKKKRKKEGNLEVAGQG